MTHDPLCTWKQAEEADAGDPRRWLAGGLAVCDCDKIAKVREDMLAKCIAALPHAHNCWANYPEQADACTCMAAITRTELRALLEKP